MSGRVKIYVENHDNLITCMFDEEGYEVVKTPNKADIICYTGGADVMPGLYSMPNYHSSIHPERDAKCMDLFYLYPDKPSVGICRGAQFLNVMCGGMLWQDVDKHGVQDTHEARDMLDGRTYQVTSTHHQMMIANNDTAELLLTANLGGVRTTGDAVLDKRLEHLPEVEAVFYQDDMCLCYQPHPEYVDKDHECRNLFFVYLQQYIINDL